VTDNTQARRLSLSFALLGAAASLLPAFIPQAAVNLGLPVTQLLNAVPVMFGGLFIGVALSPVAIRFLAATSIARFGFVLLASSLIAIPLVQSSAWFMSVAFLLGLGFGTLEVIATSEAKKLRTDTSQKLANLNAIFAIAALVSPLLLLLSSSLFGFPLPFFLVAILSLGLVPSYRSGIARVHSPGLITKKPGFRNILLMAAAVSFVGAESVLSGWSATLVSELTTFNESSAALGSSAFWALLATGRIISARLSPALISNHVALAMWSALAGTTLLGAWALWPVLDPGMVLAAFGLAALAAGPCYSLIIGQALDASEQQDAIGVTSTIVMLGAAGGFLLPAAVMLNPVIQNAAAVAGLGFLVTLLFAILASKRETSIEVEA
jgi:hypothetical protein